MYTVPHTTFTCKWHKTTHIQDHFSVISVISHHAHCSTQHVHNNCYKKGTPHKHALCALEYVLYTFWIAHEHA